MRNIWIWKWLCYENVILSLGTIFEIDLAYQTNIIFPSNKHTCYLYYQPLFHQNNYSKHSSMGNFVSLYLCGRIAPIWPISTISVSFTWISVLVSSIYWLKTLDISQNIGKHRLKYPLLTKYRLN
jgi:hypothetical protein